jgi:p24 family protein alpha
MRASLLLLLVGALCMQQANGLFFYLKEGQNKCFLEDLPKDTLVIVQVEASDISDGAVIPGYPNGDISRRKNIDTQPLGVVGEITHGKEVIIEQTVGAQGRFAFTAQSPGEYSICLRTNTSRWFGSGAIVCSNPLCLPPLTLLLGNV